MGKRRKRRERTFVVSAAWDAGGAQQVNAFTVLQKHAQSLTLPCSVQPEERKLATFLDECRRQVPCFLSHHSVPGFRQLPCTVPATDAYPDRAALLGERTGAAPRGRHGHPHPASPASFGRGVDDADCLC